MKAMRDSIESDPIDFRADSDIDLLVIEESDLPRYRRAARYRRAVAGLFVAKDIVVWSPEEIEELSDYAVSVRYDFEFWPDIETARMAIDIAEVVHSIVLNVLSLEA